MVEESFLLENSHDLVSPVPSRLTATYTAVEIKSQEGLIPLLPDWRSRPSTISFRFSLQNILPLKALLSLLIALIITLTSVSPLYP